VLGCLVAWAFSSIARAANTVDGETANKRPNALPMIPSIPLSSITGVSGAFEPGDKADAAAIMVRQQA